MKKIQLLNIIAIMLICILGMQSTAFSAPSAAEPLSSDDEVEMVELRTTRSKTYQLPSGSFKYVGYAEDIHYIDSEGAFVEINNNVTNSIDRDGYKYGNTANSWRTYFSDQLSNPNAIILEKDNYVLSFCMPSANRQVSVEKTVDMNVSGDSFYGDLHSDNRAIIYKDAFTDADVVYTVKTSGVKEDIVLKSATAPRSFEFALTADELAAIEKDGTIHFQDKAGKDVFHIGLLYMVDANGKYSESVSCSIKQAKSGYTLIITASDEFLDAEDTIYPVTIDPSVMVTGVASTFDTCVDQQYPSSNYYLSQNLWTGGALGTNAMRSYIKFTLPTNITASQVTRAYLNIKKNAYETPTIKAYRVTSSWTSSSVTWNNKPGFTETYMSSVASNYLGDWYHMDTTEIVYKWLAGSYTNYGFVLKEPNELSSSQKTRFYSSDAPSPNKPELVIYYVNSIGSRPYQATSRYDVNCMGYAVEYGDFIDMIDLGISVVEMNGKTTSQLLSYIDGKSQDWMDDHLSSSGYAPISAYDSNINTASPGWFRVVLRVGFIDFNGNGVFDTSEVWDYHWWYQTTDNYGTWADKPGSTPSRLQTGSNGIDPASLVWSTGYFNYNSTGEYYQIRDSRSIGW